jgi:hypothetical protein
VLGVGTIVRCRGRLHSARGVAGQNRSQAARPLPYARSCRPGRQPPDRGEERSAVRQPRVRGSGSPHVARGAGPSSGNGGRSGLGADCNAMRRFRRGPYRTVMAGPAIAGHRGTRATLTRLPRGGSAPGGGGASVAWPRGFAAASPYRRRAPTGGVLAGVPGGCGEPRRVCHGKPLHERIAPRTFVSATRQARPGRVCGGKPLRPI